LVDIVCVLADVAVVASDAVPCNDPVKFVEVTFVSPANVVDVPPNDIAVEPTVTLLFARLALVIPAVPDKFELVSPEIDPPSVIVPVDVIVPPVKVMPDTVPAVATDVTPLLTTLVAHDAVPINRDAVAAYEALIELVAAPAVAANVALAAYIS
jgi:hypothetical protein